MTDYVPNTLYHGTTTPGITEFEPRKRFTPGGRTDTPVRIYASDDPVFAAMHAFPWSNDEGIDIVERGGRPCLLVPRHLEARLGQPVYVYELPGDDFTLTEEEETGNTYHSESAVAPMGVQAFESVIVAIAHFGGEVHFV